MKKLSVLFAALFIGIIAAHAISVNWYVDGNVYDTTTCTVGNDITPPTPPTKYGYTFMEWVPYMRLEYIESTGTQYIDTRYTFPDDISKYKIVLDVSLPSIGGWRLNGYGAGYKGPHIGFRDYNFAVGMAVTVFGNVSASLNTRYIMSVNMGTGNYTVKTTDSENPIVNAQFSVYTDYVERPTFVLFAYREGSSINRASMRIHSFKIYDNGILVRDMIPVLDSDDIACMYDLVTKQFFYNAGTGDFTAGPVNN